jgi:hypothetical protein
MRASRAPAVRTVRALRCKPSTQRVASRVPVLVAARCASSMRSPYSRTTGLMVECRITAVADLDASRAHASRVHAFSCAAASAATHRNGRGVERFQCLALRSKRGDLGVHSLPAVNQHHPSLSVPTPKARARRVHLTVVSQ